MSEDDDGTLARLADVAHVMCDVSDGLVTDFTSPPDARPAIECLSPELVLPITATGAIKRKAGARLVDASRKRVPITASGWQHF
jgi:thiamine monophosphate kinase